MLDVESAEACQVLTWAGPCVSRAWTHSPCGNRTGLEGTRAEEGTEGSEISTMLDDRPSYSARSNML